MSGTKGKSGRERARSHDETDDRVEAALKLGPKTRTELVAETGLHMSTVWFCVQRLVKQERVRAVDGPKTITHAEQRAGRSTRYEFVGAPEARQLRVSAWTSEARRHPQDVALFGEYRRAA